MKAMLLRVGIDKGTDGVLAPIFKDGTFEYIPLSEKVAGSSEEKTFKNTMGVHGRFLSHYLPEKIHGRLLHNDPEFETNTYGEQTVKGKYLLKLEKDDLLVFYAGLTPHENTVFDEALYIIGYFIVDDVVDFNVLEDNQVNTMKKELVNNSHIKFNGLENLVVVKGKDSSRLMEYAVLISEKKLNKIGRNYHAVSKEMEALLGISGSIQRSIPPRFVVGSHVENLKDLLAIK